MTSKRTNVFILLMLYGCLHLFAQPFCRLIKYDEGNGVPSSHITRLLQDEHGFMWFSTWNGLCRFDGYEFQTFKPTVGDGCHMPSDRLTGMVLLPDGNILCMVEDDFFLFDTHNYRFRDLTEKEKRDAPALTKQYNKSLGLVDGSTITWHDASGISWQLNEFSKLSYMGKNGQVISYPLNAPLKQLRFACTDHQGNLWLLGDESIYKLCTSIQHTYPLPMEQVAEVRSLFKDSQQRYWVAAKDGTLCAYALENNQRIGYLGTDGLLHKAYTRFGTNIYCMHETTDGSLWLGSKPDGLFRLRLQGNGHYKIEHFTELPSRNIYHITQDQKGRLWIATMDGGICYTEKPQAELPIFKSPKNYPLQQAAKVRYLHITPHDIMLAATTSGLLVTRLEDKPDHMRFRLHQRESGRANSLSCSATMDIVENSKGHLFVSTESGGVNQIMSSDLLEEQLDFRHLSEFFPMQQNNIVQSLSMINDGRLMAVGSHLITLIDSTYQGRILDASYFHDDFRFSEAHPLQLDKTRWMFGLTNGAFITNIEQMSTTVSAPRLVLTAVSVQGDNPRWNVEHLDTLKLLPQERSVTVYFAALDYTAPERISYAFRLLSSSSKDEPWHHVGHSRSATLLDLSPGTYQLEIQSTNADGVWQEQIRTLTIIVEPTFWESVWGRLLLLLIVVVIIGGIAYTYYYIQRIKRKQHETLEAYLALIESKSNKAGAIEQLSQYNEEQLTSDPLIQRVMTFIEENIGNSDASVGDMAEAAAISRSGLQRKLKQAMGITPQDLLREARIKRACQMLIQSNRSVSEIAYACGFTDPKYFSRCFKQSTGKLPSEYKNSVN